MIPRPCASKVGEAVFTQRVGIDTAAFAALAAREIWDAAPEAMV